MQKDRTISELKKQQAPAYSDEMLERIHIQLFPGEKVPDFNLLTDREKRRLVNMVRRLAGKPPSKSHRVDRHQYVPKLSGDDGYVYFIQSEHDPSIIKIGWSSNPSGRLADLQIGSPTELRMIYLFRGYLSKKTEQNFHKKFKRNRFRGEWFKFTTRQLDRIEKEFAGRLIYADDRYDKPDRLSLAS